jgi:hypothetical protein
MKNRITKTVFPCFALFTAILVYGQEPEVFTRSDFQVRGPVKQLIVRASYGLEQFDFDRSGRLTKSVTRYSEKDYDITYYIFSGNVLKERRDEVYRDGVIDRQSSIARVYQIDSLANQMLEAVSSYDRSITERLSLQYDSLQRLIQVRRAYNEGVDETRVDYESKENKELQHFSINGMRYKSVATFSADSIGSGYQIIRTESFRMHVPQTAYEMVSDAQGRKISEYRYGFNADSDTWEVEQLIRYTYNKDGLVATQTSYSATGQVTPPVLEFTYQMDGASPANWVRQVTQPELSIVARQIFYY